MVLFFLCGSLGVLCGGSISSLAWMKLLDFRYLTGIMRSVCDLVKRKLAYRLSLQKTLFFKNLLVECVLLLRDFLTSMEVLAETFIRL